MTKKFHYDIPVGTCLLIFSIWVFWVATNISGEAKLLPSALAVLMIICSLVILIRGARSTKANTDGSRIDLTQHKNAFLFMLFIFSYYLGFRFIGYWVVTPVFLILAQKWLKVKSWKVNLIVTVTYTVVAYVLFVIVLKLPIYKVGILGRFFRFV